MKTSLYILLLAVALVLVIDCANIANLLLVRGSGRLRELAVRTAVGASRARLVRQLLTETLLLADGGALGGILLAYLGLPVLLRWAPAFVPRLDDIQMNGTVLCVCGTVGLLASVLFGLAPAIHASRVDPHRDLRSAGSRGVVGGTVLRLRQIFITAQIALCLVLLVSAGLLLRSFMALTSVDLGFRSANLLVAHISVPEGERRVAVDRVFTPLLEQAAADSSVVNVALSRSLPSDPDTRSTVSYIIPGQTPADMNTTAPQAGVSVISGSYFETVGIPLFSGQTFSARDHAAAPLTVVVNQALVKQSFPKQNPVGLKILCGYDEISMKWMTVVGVVADARLDGPKAAPMPELYLPYQQHPTLT
ncbi:MAG: FtsX-like permease family protein [Bryobacteraceae bacterium]